MTDEEKEREHCGHEAIEFNKTHGTFSCVDEPLRDLLIRERAAAITPRFTQMLQREQSRSLALRSLLAIETQTGRQYADVLSDLQTKHAALVKAARAAVVMLDLHSLHATAGMLHSALEGEP